jgi:hypothetical protein
MACPQRHDARASGQSTGMAETTSTPSALGPRFAQVLATKDYEALRAVLHADVDFRGLTPNRFWEAHDRDAVLDIVFGVWFGSGPSWTSSRSWNPTPSPTANRSASAFAGVTGTGR